jgi:hypothetical protein
MRLDDLDEKEAEEPCNGVFLLAPVEPEDLILPS